MDVLATLWLFLMRRVMVFKVIAADGSLLDSVVLDMKVRVRWLKLAKALLSGRRVRWSYLTLHSTDSDLRQGTEWLLRLEFHVLNPPVMVVGQGDIMAVPMLSSFPPHPSMVHCFYSTKLKNPLIDEDS